MVAGRHPVRRRGRIGPVAGRDPVASRARGDPQLAAGERGGRGGRELPPAVRHLGPGALPRRRVRAPRRGAVLQSVQPARGRYLSGHSAGRCADHPPQPALAQPDSAAGPPDLVRRGALRPPSGVGLEHALGAPVQQPAALRAPATAEPQHDHGGHGGLCALRGVDRPHGVAAVAGADDALRPDHGARSGRGGGGLGHLGAGVASHARLAVRRGLAAPGYRRHRPRGDGDRACLLSRSGGAGLDPAPLGDRCPGLAWPRSSWPSTSG